MPLRMPQALAEAHAARGNVEEWIRAVNRRKVEYAILQKRRVGETQYLYDMVSECLAFLGQHGECDEAMRLIMSVMAYEEALANVACADTSQPTDLQQIHHAADDTPDYLR